MAEKIVIVEYYDPATLSGWEPRMEVEREKPYLCETIGWVVSEDKDFLRLSAMRCDQIDNFNNRAMIPKGCIVSTKEILSPNGETAHKKNPKEHK